MRYLECVRDADDVADQPIQARSLVSPSPAERPPRDAVYVARGTLASDCIQTLAGVRRSPSMSREPCSTDRPHTCSACPLVPPRRWALLHLRHGHVPDADPQVIALFRRRARDNGSLRTLDLWCRPRRRRAKYGWSTTIWTPGGRSHSTRSYTTGYRQSRRVPGFELGRRRR